MPTPATSATPAADPTAVAEDAWSIDRALLVRWRAGEAAAGEELLGRYRRFFASVCRRLGVLDEDDIIELHQDVMVVLVRNLDALPDRIASSFAGWLAWQVRDALSRRRRATLPTAPLPDRATPAAGDLVRDAAIRDAVARCAERLPAREREVFALRFLGELEIGETARRLGLAANAVSQAAYRLSRRLRRCLAEAGFES
jgi:RNA polymerase sigma factor (sigma-70 family)